MTNKERQKILDRNEQTRQGNNPCPICGNPRHMYFSPWCPLDDKPKIYKGPELNFVQCLEHLEALGHSGIRNRLWSHFDEIRNNTSFELYFPKADEKDGIDPQIWDDIYLIKSTWNITDESIRVFVSW